MPKTNPKYIFVVGGVMSSVGKGVTSASIAKLIQARGYKVACMKCDMYVNIDAGTIRPAEHGEVFVGADGVEADQDLGNYERFTDEICTLDNYITTGQIYQEVIRRERNLEYGGEDVEVVPDVPKEIIRRIEACQKNTGADVMVIEFGGTIGEYQLLLFLEAARMMKVASPEDVSIVMVSYLPTPSLLGEQKSKPTQYAIRTLNSAGLAPDFIFCRASKHVTPDIKRTISNVCSLPEERIVSAPNVDFIYEVPLVFAEQGVGKHMLEALHLKPNESKMDDWEKLVDKIKSVKKEVTIGIVGKYFNMKSCRDTYISVIESIYHACWANARKPNIVWIDAEKFEKDAKTLKELDGVDGIVVPGGFGERGTEGMILAAEYARENKIPYLGLCLGMQILTIEFARNVCGLNRAHSEELDPKTPHPVIHIMEEQKKHMAEKNYGATMRLGVYECKIKEGTKSAEAYKKKSVMERHRHRFEFNNAYRDRLQEAGLVIAGVNPTQDLVEIVEVKDHPFFVGVQFHPEFQSRPLSPHPLFVGFVKAASE
ncbi:MAG: CTP synthase [bacterium]